MRNRLTCLLGLGFAALMLSSSAQGQSMSESVREKMKNATAQIGVGFKEPEKDEIKVMGYGSGWFINSSGLLMTNNHVVMLAHMSDNPFENFMHRSQFSVLQYPVTLHGGTDDEVTYFGDLLYQCESADLAIVQVKDKDGDFLYTPDYLSLIPSSDVRKGQRIWVFGYPGGKRFSVDKDKQAPVQITNGNIISVERHPSGRIGKFNTDAQGAPGNSGGPCVDENGDLVGVLVEARASVDANTGVIVGLVPADVAKDMMRAAMGLNKIETELRPFLDLLYDKNGRVFIPDIERDKNNDRIVFADDAQKIGRVLDNAVTFETDFGKISVPRDFAGYAHSEEGRMTLLMDGGDRLSGEASSCNLKFSTSTGVSSLKDMSINMANLRGVMFSRPSEALVAPDKPSVSIRSGDDTVLTLSDIKGEVVLETEDGETKKFKLDEIRKIETASYKTVVHKINGASFRGEFKPHTLEATMTWTGEPVEISFTNVKSAQFRPLNPANRWGIEYTVAGLAGVTDQDLLPIAAALEAGKLKKAGGMLDELLDEDVFREYPKPLRYQIKVLHGEYLLRSGEYADAAEAFRSVKNAQFPTNEYGLSRYHVLQKYEDGKYFGEPLSDPAVFHRAGHKICAALVEEARDIMISHRKTRINKFSRWKSLDRELARQEEPLMIAEFLHPGSAEMDLFRVWRSRSKFMFATGIEIRKQMQDLQAEIETRRADNKPTNSQQRKLDRLQADFSKLLTAYGTLREVMNPIGYNKAGYRVDDPDAMDILD